MAALPPISGAPPRFPSQTQGIQPAANPRAAAQKAFFDAALKRAQAPDAAQAAAAPIRTTAAAAPTRVQQPLIQISDTPPDRPLRPGSMLNILV